MCQVYAVDDSMDESKLAKILGANLKKGWQYKSLEVRLEIKLLTGSSTLRSREKEERK